MQDFEPWFMPMGYDQIRARLSYTYGFKAVCIGRWLPHKLAGEAGVSAASFPFGADVSVYRPLEDAPWLREKAVCAVYQPADKPRRCGPLLLDAMRIVHEIDPEVKIYYFGSGNAGDIVPGYPGEVLGNLPIEECNRLYNRCAVGVCLSASNPSRVPFEMMAAGLPVVDLHVQNNLYDSIEAAELLAYPAPVDLAGAMLSLLADEGKRAAMGAAGVVAMKSRPLTDESRQAADLLEAVACGKEMTGENLGGYYAAQPYRANDELRAVAKALAAPLASATAPTPPIGAPSKSQRLARKLRGLVSR